ncbi:MAG: AbrB/MazE/SpoVT family DNA-binding domain-containing protein [Thermoguttaceae bacterium]|jgi:AbrB family looped-hinge helix DNA binding protein|nr:AbrB/MazE/SpoVT family DNA-binding domain-containing protein [Thermoguttaceae bacterium]
MSTTPTFTESARISPQGALFLPKDVRSALGVQEGDRVSFIVADGVVQLVNPAIYAMNQLQDAMEGEAERMGFASVDDAMNYVNELRKEERKS